MTALLPSFEAYATAAHARGFDEVAVRDWAPDTVVSSHGHPFAVEALVVRGEMWLGGAQGTRHLRPGNTFALEPDEPHDERYGPAGATYWAARRNPHS